jgi:hypothetical protein
MTDDDDDNGGDGDNDHDLKTTTTLLNSGLSLRSVIYFTVERNTFLCECSCQMHLSTSYSAHHGTPTMFQNIDEVRDLIATHMNGTIDGCFITVDGLSAGFS